MKSERSIRLSINECVDIDGRLVTHVSDLTRRKELATGRDRDGGNGIRMASEEMLLVHVSIHGLNNTRGSKWKHHRRRLRFVASELA